MAQRRQRRRRLSEGQIKELVATSKLRRLPESYKDPVEIVTSCKEPKCGFEMRLRGVGMKSAEERDDIVAIFTRVVVALRNRHRADHTRASRAVLRRRGK